MTEVNHYESVRRKMSIGGIGTPKHKKTIEFLKMLYNDEEIKLLDTFDRAYQLLSSAKLAKKANLEKAKVKKILKNLRKRGLIFDMGGKYMIMNLVPGFFEHYILTRGDTEENTKKAAEFFRWAFMNLTPQMFNDMKLQKDAVWYPKLPIHAEEKIIEIDESVSIDDQKIMTGELVRELIDKNDFYAKIYCQCREVAKMTGEPCEYASEELGCLLCGLTGRILVDQGLAIEIPSKEEAIKYVQECEKAGLIHYGMNIGAITFICNCCRDCCCGLRGMVETGLTYGRSNFDPKWNPEACTLCDLCVKKCPMGAITHQYPIREEPERMIFNLERCLGCGVCAANCPNNAITLIKVRTEDTPEISGVGKMIQDGILGVKE